MKSRIPEQLVWVGRRKYRAMSGRLNIRAVVGGAAGDYRALVQAPSLDEIWRNHAPMIDHADAPTQNTQWYDQFPQARIGYEP